MGSEMLFFQNFVFHRRDRPQGKKVYRRPSTVK